MASRTNYNFKKHQKDLKRKEKAKKKLDRRQGKKDLEEKDVDERS